MIDMDLELKKLGNFQQVNGCVKYLDVFLSNGVKYILDNGYEWLLRYMICTLKLHDIISKLDFVIIRVQSVKNEVVVSFSDGNNIILENFHEKDKIKADFVLLYKRKENLLMLNSEYD